MSLHARRKRRLCRWFGSGITIRTILSGQLVNGKGYLRLKTGRIDTDFLSARNTLTQRTIGPVCSGTTSMDVSDMKEGDFAGLALLQKKYGWIGVKYENGVKKIVMVSAQTDRPEEVESLPLNQIQ